MRLKTFTKVREFLWYYCSPDCALPTQWVWDLILSCLCPFCHLLVASSLSLDVVPFFFFFLVGSGVLWLMVAQQLVVILVLSQEWMSILYFSLLFWTRSIFFFCSVCVTSITASSKSAMHSSLSPNLLFISFNVFFILFIVFFSFELLFFIFSRFLSKFSLHSPIVFLYVTSILITIALNSLFGKLFISLLLVVF